MRPCEIAIRATEHANAREAIEHLAASGDRRAILVGGKYLTADRAEIDKIEARGVEFAYLVRHKPTGRIMTIPVNDR
jgi:hypothetical protein